MNMPFPDYQYNIKLGQIKILSKYLTKKVNAL